MQLASSKSLVHELSVRFGIELLFKLAFQAQHQIQIERLGCFLILSSDGRHPLAFYHNGAGILIFLLIKEVLYGDLVLDECLSSFMIAMHD